MSYGVPSGGGWGRSFGRRFITANNPDKMNCTNNSTNSLFKSEGKPGLNTNFISYKNYGLYPFVNSNFMYSSWNYSNHEQPQKYQYLIKNVSNVENNNGMEPLLRSSDKYDIDTNTYQVNEGKRDHVSDTRSIDYANNVALTNHIGNNYDINLTQPIYSDEWQSTEEKLHLKFQ